MCKQTNKQRREVDIGKRKDPLKITPKSSKKN